MELLRNILIEKIKLTEKHLEQLLKVTKQIHLKSKEFFVRAESICTSIGFVNKGILRSYILRNNKEFNTDFYLPDSIVGAYRSFSTCVPSTGDIQALSDCEIITISYSDYNNLLNTSAEWYKLGKYISDTLFVKKCIRESSLLTDSASERYKLLLKTYPEIEKLVPQYHIASYLGIKPESLSRIKSLTYIKEK